MHIFNVLILFSVDAFVQIGPDGLERRTTKQESAWLFRIWYNFDQKYPLWHDSKIDNIELKKKPNKQTDLSVPIMAVLYVVLYTCTIPVLYVSFLHNALSYYQV